MGCLIFYIVATFYLRRGRRDVKLRAQDVLRKLFAEWDISDNSAFVALTSPPIIILASIMK